MNITLWVLQVLLALHTAIGAVWKFSHSEQAVPSLNAIPHDGWLALIVIELLCVVGLLLPAIKKSLGTFAPTATLIIALEMLMFSIVHLISLDEDHGPMLYWLVVAAICVFITFGRLVLRPIRE